MVADNKYTWGVDSALKWFTGLVLLITALGLPIVAFQFSRLGIPVQLLPRTLALRAGVLPVIVLTVATAYTLWVLKGNAALLEYGQSSEYPADKLKLSWGFFAFPFLMLIVALTQYIGKHLGVSERLVFAVLLALPAGIFLACSRLARRAHWKL